MVLFIKCNSAEILNPRLNNSQSASGVFEPTVKAVQNYIATQANPGLHCPCNFRDTFLLDEACLLAFLLFIYFFAYHLGFFNPSQAE